jgi:hypothetical protein
MHTDASDITLNVCLGKASYTPLLDARAHTLTKPPCTPQSPSHSPFVPLTIPFQEFTGAGLTFCGVRGAGAHGEELQARRG